MSSKKTYTVRPSLLALTALVAVSANVFMDSSATAQVSLSIPTLTGMTAIDDGDAGYTGTAKSLAFPQAYKKDLSYMKGEESRQSASWEFSGLKAGTYNVYATWPALGSNSPAVTYNMMTTKGGNKISLPNVIADQRNTPSDGMYDGAKWKRLTTVTIEGDMLAVAVNATGQFTVVDGIAIQKTADAPAQNKDKTLPLPVPVSSSSRSSVAANVVTLNSIVVTGANVTVNYTKNFTTCAHMVTPAKQIVHSVNMFCVNAGPVTVPLTQFNSLFGVGRSFMLCHGNSYNTCSNTVIVQSSISTSSYSSSRSSSSVNCPTHCDAQAGCTYPSPVFDEKRCVVSCGPIVCASSSTRSSIMSSNRSSLSSSSNGYEYFCNGHPQSSPCSSFSSRSSFSSGQSSSYSVISESFSRSSVMSSAKSAGTLFVTEKETGVANTAVRNQKDVVLKRFTFTAGPESDINVSSIQFTGFNNANLLNGQNYTIWADTTDDGVVDTIFKNNVSPSGNVITFPLVFTVIRANQTIAFEVHADIASSPIDNVLALSVATASSTAVTADVVGSSTPLSGIQVDTTPCPNAYCQIRIFTAVPTVYTIVSQGDLFVSRDQQPRSRQLLGGALGDDILRLQFRANNEDIDVTTLRFNSSGSLSTSIDRLELYKLGDITPFAVATSGACGALGGSFCAQMQGQQLVVPEGQVKIVTVRPRLKSDVNGAISNEFIRIMIHPQVPSSITARGVFSSSNLINNDNDGVPEGEVFIGTDIPELNRVMVGPGNYTVLSKIVSIENANPDADGTNIPTGIAPAGQFRFTAAANTNSANGLNRVTITDLIFRVTAPNVQFNANGFKVFNRADASMKTPCYVLDYVPGSTSFLVACWDIASGGVDTRINSGNSLSLALQVDITNSKVSNFQQSALQVSIDSFNNPALQGMASNLSHIRWVDSDVSASQQFWWVEHGDSVVKSTSYQS